MKKKNCVVCVIAVIAAILAVAAGVTLAVIYRENILAFLSTAKETFEKKKYARISRKEYEDYADVE